MCIALHTPIDIVLGLPQTCISHFTELVILRSCGSHYTPRYVIPPCLSRYKKIDNFFSLLQPLLQTQDKSCSSSHTVRTCASVGRNITLDLYFTHSISTSPGQKMCHFTLRRCAQCIRFNSHVWTRVQTSLGRIVAINNGVVISPPAAGVPLAQGEHKDLRAFWPIAADFQRDRNSPSFCQ